MVTICMRAAGTHGSSVVSEYDLILRVSRLLALTITAAPVLIRAEAHSSAQTSATTAPTSATPPGTTPLLALCLRFMPTTLRFEAAGVPLHFLSGGTTPWPLHMLQRGQHCQADVRTVWLHPKSASSSAVCGSSTSALMRFSFSELPHAPMPNISRSRNVTVAFDSCSTGFRHSAASCFS
jgi:hypothetical protein